MNFHRLKTPSSRQLAPRIFSILALLVSVLSAVNTSAAQPPTDNAAETLSPAEAHSLQSAGIKLTAGLRHTCAATSGGILYCWGGNGDGQLGDGTMTSRLTPTLVSGVASVVVPSAGDRHTCAVTSAGVVFCWGDNYHGQLGDGTTTGHLTPTLVSGLSGVVALSVGYYHTCALTNGGQVFCWGFNYYGQVGDGTSADRSLPTPVTTMGAVTAIAAAWVHTCAISSGGQVYCWGANYSGQLGDGTTTHHLTPTLVSSLSNIAALAVGAKHTCAATTGGQAYCWGENYYGQLGSTTNVGTYNPNPTPLPVSGVSGVIALDAGEYHTCAKTSGGQVYCWGGNDSGQLGNGTSSFSPNPTPTLVSSLSNVAVLATGSYHTCAAMSGTQAHCWGWNNHGQVGDGTTINRLTPTLVQGVFVDPPGAFTKTAPPNGATLQPTNPTLQWQTPSGTVNHYRYCISTSTNCTPSTQTTNTSVALSGLLAATTYYWQVRACADTGCTVFTDASGGHGSFTVLTHNPPNTGSGSTPGLDDAEIVGSNLHTTKSVTPTSVSLGELVTFTLTLSNGTPYATVVHVTDTLPAGLGYIGVVGTTPTPSVSGQSLRWDGVSVPANGMRQLVFRAQGVLPEMFSSAFVVGDQNSVVQPTSATASVTVKMSAFVPIVRRP